MRRVAACARMPKGAGPALRPPKRSVAAGRQGTTGVFHVERRCSLRLLAYAELGKYSVENGFVHAFPKKLAQCSQGFLQLRGHAFILC